MYNRLVNFKVDLDVYGTRNRVEHIKMVNVGERHPDLVNPSEKVSTGSVITACKSQ